MTAQMSRNCESRVAQTQMKDALEGNHIQHQFSTHQQSSLKIYNTFSVPNSHFGIKCCHSKL